MIVRYHSRDAKEFAEFVRLAAKFGLVVVGERILLWHEHVRSWRESKRSP